MAYSFIAATAQGGFGASGGTTSGIDTSGSPACDFLAVGAAMYLGESGVTVADNKGNSANYIQLTERTSAGGEVVVRWWYCKNASGGSGHTFSVTGSTCYPAIFALAFSGSDTTAPFDVENGSNTSSNLTSVSAGSVTPSVDNELVLTICGLSNGSTASTAAASGYTVPNSVNYSAGVNEAVAIGYQIQTTATTTNPAWSWTGSSLVAAAVATFKAGAGGGGGGGRGLFRTPSQSGIGIGGSFFRDPLQARERMVKRNHIYIPERYAA